MTIGITEVRVRLADRNEGHSHRGLLAWCSVTFAGCFVVHDVRVVKRSRQDGLVVSMPNRNFRAPCPSCRGSVERHHRFCGHCGGPMPDLGPRELKDVAHPLDPDTRAVLDKAVLAAYAAESARGGPGCGRYSPDGALLGVWDGGGS